MADILIVYGSTTGNTEQAATIIDNCLQDAGYEAELKNVTDVEAEGLCKGRDLVIFGCSTWGQDEIELQDDFISLFDAFDKIGARGAKTAVFGCGEEGYPYFCGAVDAITDKLVELGADVVGGKLKINGDPDEAEDEIKDWTKGVVKEI